MMGDSYISRTPLMRHQVQGVRMLARQGGGALLFQPGLGKTLTTLTWLAMLTKKYGHCRVVVLAPKVALDTWEDEVDKHLDLEQVATKVEILTQDIAERVFLLRKIGKEDKFEGLHLIITNHEALSATSLMPGTATVTRRTAMVEALRKANLDAMVVDELHRAKGRSSNLQRALASLSPSIPRRVGLTGTVMPHDPGDIWGQWQWINPNRFVNPRGVPLRFTQFQQLYCQMGGFQGKQVIGPRNEKALSRLMAQDSLSIRKSEALDLPPVTHHTINVKLSLAERRTYLEMGKNLLADLEDGQTAIAANQAVKWMRLRQITSGHLTDEFGEVVEVGSSKIARATELVQSLVEADEKVVVFCHFIPELHRMVDALNRRFAKQYVPVAAMWGNTPMPQRRVIRKEFASLNGPSVVVAQMRTASLAINEFVAASHGVILSCSERRDDYVQALDRLDRHGQTNPVTFWHLEVPNSVDSAVRSALEGRGRLEQMILSHGHQIATLGEAA